MANSTEIIRIALIALLVGVELPLLAEHFMTHTRAGVVTRKRLLCMADDAGNLVTRVPETIQKATEVARNAFIEALRESEGH